MRRSFRAVWRTGFVRAIDGEAAAEAPGVRAIVTYRNAPRLNPVKTLLSTELDRFLPLQDNRLHYDGQPIAIIVANSLMEATHAASLVTAEYEGSSASDFSFEAALPYASDAPKVGASEPAKINRGKPEPAFAKAPIQVDRTFSTAAAHHNALEPAAAIAALGCGGATGRLEHHAVRLRGRGAARCGFRVRRTGQQTPACFTDCNRIRARERCGWSRP